jgi:hypothetical protein
MSVLKQRTDNGTSVQTDPVLQTHSGSSKRFFLQPMMRVHEQRRECLILEAS